jgi:CRP-like cAMP-binding protein
MAVSKTSLIHYIQQIISISDEKANAVSENFEFKEAKKNTFILQENKTSKYTYYLASGFIRSFTHDINGQEVTTNLFSAPCFVNDFLSFFKQQPSHENFQTLTDCMLWSMTYEEVQKKFHTMPEFREFGRLMLVTNYSKLNNRMLGMIKDTAETRYLALIDQHPEIFKHVALKMIASYLGITDSSLSRIRKELVHK